MNPPKPVSAEFYTTVPAGDDDQMIRQFRPLKHAHYHQTRAAFAVGALKRWAIRQNHRPGVMRRFGEFLVAFERLERGIHVSSAFNRTAADRIFAAALCDHIQDLLHLKPRDRFSDHGNPLCVGRVGAKEAISWIRNAFKELRATQRIIARALGQDRAQTVGLELVIL